MDLRCAVSNLQTSHVRGIAPDNVITGFAVPIWGWLLIPAQVVPGAAQIVFVVYQRKPLLYRQPVLLPRNSSPILQPGYLLTLPDPPQYPPTHLAPTQYLLYQHAGLDCHAKSPQLADRQLAEVQVAHNGTAVHQAYKYSLPIAETSLLEIIAAHHPRQLHVLQILPPEYLPILLVPH